ncbi:MAG TPA: hypothetical protein EYP57_00135 [Thermodesulfobacteriaceae bacterium]|nr:hypothetical protein [Thermodesulfobacteriaceae bacterium]
MRKISAFLTISILVFTFAECASGKKTGNSGADPDRDRLIQAVKQLHLGLDGYFLCEPLTEKQLDIARSNAVKKSYPGTMKFKDGDLFVVADTSSGIILALYEHRKDVLPWELKNLVGGLMLTFGDPTTMAHEKVIYWAYNSKGRISEETFTKAKKTGKIDILATVKLNSSQEIMKTASEGNQTSDVYFIVTSEPVLKFFTQ